MSSTFAILTVAGDPLPYAADLNSLAIAFISSKVAIAFTSRKSCYRDSCQESIAFCLRPCLNNLAGK